MTSTDDLYAGMAWDFDAIRKLTPEDHERLAPAAPPPRVLLPDRTKVRPRIRFLMIRDHPYCTLCGQTVEDGARLEIDHIDGDRSNSHPSNLQVLCHRCNIGKWQDAWPNVT